MPTKTEITLEAPKDFVLVSMQNFGDDDNPKWFLVVETFLENGIVITNHVAALTHNSVGQIYIGRK